MRTFARSFDMVQYCLMVEVAYHNRLWLAEQLFHQGQYGDVATMLAATDRAMEQLHQAHAVLIGVPSVEEAA